MFSRVGEANFQYFILRLYVPVYFEFVNITDNYFIVIQMLLIDDIS